MYATVGDLSPEKSIASTPPFKEGESFKIIIKSFSINYTLNDPFDQYYVDSGIFIGFPLNVTSIFHHNTVPQDGTNATPATDSVETIITQRSDPDVFLLGTNITDVSYNCQVIKSNNTHVLIHISEINYNLTLSNFLGNFASPTFSPGVRIIDKTNKSNLVNAWALVSIFPNNHGRNEMEESATRENCANCYEKIGPNTFQMPNKLEQGSYFRSYPDTPLRTWTFYPHSSRIQSITAEHSNVYWDVLDYYHIYSAELTTSMYLELEFIYE